MKSGDRVQSSISLRRTGVDVGQVEHGTIVEYRKGRSYSVKTGFGREKHRTPDRALVHWDKGPEGWVDAEFVEEETDMLYDNPRRPPKKWFRDCVRGVRAGARRSGRSIRDPAAVCGAQWQRLSASRKRAAVRRSERRRNPYDYIPNPW